MSAATVELLGETLATFLPLVLERLLRFLAFPDVEAPFACFLAPPPPLVVDLFACCFLGAGFCVAAFVHAATALVRAAVDSTHLSWAEGLAVGPTSALKSSTSEKSPAVVTSDCRIRNFASADWKQTNYVINIRRIILTVLCAFMKKCNFFWVLISLQLNSPAWTGFWRYRNRGQLAAWPVYDGRWLQPTCPGPVASVCVLLLDLV